MSSRRAGELRNSEWREHGLVEANALRVAARVHVDVVEEHERPVPAFSAHAVPLATPACHEAQRRA
jgi:hypothetical protein